MTWIVRDSTIRGLFKIDGLAPDPPWKRQRRARAPPPQAEIFSTVLDEEFSQIPPEDKEDL